MGYSANQLVEMMTISDTHDMELSKMLLILYPKFMTPIELLDRLLDVFDSYKELSEEDENRLNQIHPVRLRVCNILIHWCSNFWGDFYPHKMRFTLHVFYEFCLAKPAYAAICQKLSNFIFRPANRTRIDWADDMGDYVDDVGGNGNNDLLLDSDAASRSSVVVGARLPQEISAMAASFLDLDNALIVQQLNRIEEEIFIKIQPRDLLQHMWSLSRKGEHASSVAESIRHFNFISSWVVTMILGEKKIQQRAKMLSKFMHLASDLRNSNNYNTLMAVLS
ncbi:hypothetical protein HDU76_011887, partial [Blyttiomyces sp. JEL0837]